MADIHYKRRFGDRNDGRLLRSLAPYFKFIPFVMKDRNDASNYFSDKSRSATLTGGSGASVRRATRGWVFSI